MLKLHLLIYKNKKMEIRPKSQAELNSQAMAFAAYEHETSAEREEIVAMTRRDIGAIATNAMYPQYLNFLRHRRGSRQETIDKRTELQERYTTEFKPSVDQLKQSLEGMDEKQKHESYVNAGTQANVFGFTKDGKEYVVRALKYGASDKVLIDRYMAGTLDVQGNPHFEQIVAASYDDEVTVAERMPGKNLSEISVEDMNQMTDEQMQEFIKTLKIAQNSNIKLDTIAANFMYDKDAGFGLIDLDSTNFGGVYRGQELGDKLASISQVFQGMGDKARKYSLLDTDKIEFYQEMASYTQAKIGVMNRYRTALQEANLSEADKERAIGKINNEIIFLERQLTDFTDPVRVNEQMSRAAERMYQSPPMNEVSETPNDQTWEAPTPTMNF